MSNPLERLVPFLIATTLCACSDKSALGDEGPVWLPDAGTSMCADGPLSAPLTDCSPVAPTSTGNAGLDCVNRINQLRWECQCLPPLARWTGGEACASEQAEYDSTRTPHAGFQANICDSGFGQNECPGWPSVGATQRGCLQQMWDEGPGEDFQAHGHYLNMTNDRFDEVACGFFTTDDGKVWAVHNFR